MSTFAENSSDRDSLNGSKTTTNKKVVFGTKNNYNLASLHASSILFVCTKNFFSFKLIVLLD